jgi:serine protease Do
MFRKSALAMLFVACMLLSGVPARGALPEFTDLAKKAGPAVVNISTVQVVETSQRLHEFFSPFQRKGTPFHEFFEEFFDQMPRKRKENSLGSGFIISRDGYIVTNYHVIQKADEIKVILQEGEESYGAEVIGTDPATDLALLKIDADRQLPTLDFGNSDKLEKGDWVLAIGNPFGLDHTVTAGIISAKGRVIGAGPYDNFLQTDASINPGNSGGPLLNLQGKVVGINSAIVASGQGIGFAIPSNMAENVISELRQHKTVRRGWLGVTIQDVDENTAKALGLERAQGALVASVKPGDPADKAGIESGDVIVSVEGETIEGARDLTRTIGRLPPGEEIEMGIWSEGEVRKIELTLGQRPSQAKIAQQEQEKEPSGPGALGMKLRPVTQREAEALGLAEAKGLLVVEVQADSPAAEANMRRGDVILEANGRPVNDMEALEEVLQGDAEKKGVLLLLISRKGQNLFRTIPLEE